MSAAERPDDDIVRALGPRLGVALYDPVVALVMRERLFRGRLVAQVLADPPPGRPLDVVELGCGTGTNSIRLAAAGARVIGVDADPEILARRVARRARKRSTGAPAESSPPTSPTRPATASSSPWSSTTSPTRRS